MENLNQPNDNSDSVANHETKLMRLMADHFRSRQVLYEYIVDVTKDIQAGYLGKNELYDDETGLASICDAPAMARYFEAIITMDDAEQDEKVHILNSEINRDKNDLVQAISKATQQTYLLSEYESKSIANAEATLTSFLGGFSPIIKNTAELAELIDEISDNLTNINIKIIRSALEKYLNNL